MARRRITLEKDVNRLAESIHRDHGFKIKDRDSFNVAFDDFFEGKELNRKQNTRLRNKVFDHMVHHHPNISRESLFKKAGGKDLRKDRRTTAKKVVKSKKEYIKTGASKIDLEGYDTKQPKRKSFRKIGRSKGKIVYVRKDTYLFKNKVRIVYRDRLGRFASIKK